MKTRIYILFIVVTLVLVDCSKFWDDSLTGPTEFVRGASNFVQLALDKSVLDISDSLIFKSDMWLNSDSSDTEFREVLFADELTITTLVNESNYRARISWEGITYFTGYTLGGVQLTNALVNEEQGIWFLFGVDPDGNIVQDQDNLADTINVPIEVFAPAGNEYHFNGTGTDHDARLIPWDADLGHYHVDMLTFPGTHRYNWWGSGIDSVRIGNKTIYSVDGGYIRFEIESADQVSVLNSFVSMLKVSWQDTASADTVIARFSDYTGERNYFLDYQTNEWSRNVPLPLDSLIYARVEADHISQVTGIAVNDTELHHLVAIDTSYYMFAFRMIDNEVVQDSANNFINMNINP